MKHVRGVAAALLIAIAGIVCVPPASSQITIHLNDRHRPKHYVYHHPRYVEESPRRTEYHPPRVVYYRRHYVRHPAHEGVRLRLRIR
jgi:hypothetical protein